MKTYDLIVYIGRFQPFHNAHLETVKRASEQAKQVLILVGSASAPTSYKNPFTSSERRNMILNACDDARIMTDVIVRELEDNPYNDTAWQADVQRIVASVSGVLSYETPKVALIGHNKDDSSFYLKMFPQWDFVDMPLVEPLDATQIREIYFSSRYNANFVRAVLPPSTLKFLDDFAKYSSRYDMITAEKEFVIKYKQQFANLPYAPVFVTVDSVVLCQGHILLVKRGSFPGRGQWALPGGFLDAKSDRSVKDGAIRELKEETKIKVPLPVLYGSITDNKVFDAPDRSARGRTITHAFKIELKDTELPKVKGSDDAIEARWVPVGEVSAQDCFEDHFHIIQYFVGA